MSDLSLGRTVSDSKPLLYPPATSMGGASVLETVLGRGRRSVGTGVCAGGRAFGRIRRAEENIKGSEAKIAVWSQERGALAAEPEAELAAVRRDVEAEAARREQTRVPVGHAEVRVLEWYVLWS